MTVSQKGLGASGISAMTTVIAITDRTTMILRPTRSPSAPQSGPTSAEASGPAA
jgi:hypothetical protein